MFNRQPFNRGKFNVGSSGVSDIDGIGRMTLATNKVVANKSVGSKGISLMKMAGSANAVIMKYGKTKTEMNMTSKLSPTKIIIALPGTSSAIMTTTASQSLTGESSIFLEGINLGFGDELVINTCDMTVTVNGQNAMEFFGFDSDFFSLLNGKNILEYSDDNNTREISFDVIWKDRWL